MEKQTDIFEEELNPILEGEDDGSIEVDIVDDTPPEDRNINPLPKEIANELEKADELEEYTHNVKTKFKQYKKAWHDERREKERAQREQEEALAIAQKAFEENKRLRSLLETGEKEYINVHTTNAELEVAKAKEAYKQAYDTGDADKIVEAQEDLIKASQKLDKAKNLVPNILTKEPEEFKPPQKATTPQVDPKVEKWIAENPWYRDPSKKSMARFALGVHEQLVDEHGINYATTDEYFRKIDEEVKRRFPEEFPAPNAEEKTGNQKASTVVAPVKRSTGPRKVVLTQTQLAIAKKLNVSPEAYAREIIKLENKNG